MESCSAVILAAGKGTRMNSDQAKVLHRLAGKPLINWVVDTALDAGCAPIVVVVGHQADEVRSVLPEGIRTVLQEPQQGTGHALMCAKEALEGAREYLCVLYGDVPLIRPGTIARMLRQARDEDAAAVVLSFMPEGEHAYGRIVRDDTGRVVRIVEHRDADESQRAIREANSGIYIFHTASLLETLDHIGNENAQGEYYLTDAIEILLQTGKNVVATVSETVLEVSGVNSPEELRRLETLILGKRD